MNPNVIDEIQILHAAWFVTPDGVLPNTRLVLDSGRLREVQTSHRTDGLNLGEVAVIPGLVNAHTHLEFSLLREPIPISGRFTDWIRSVVSYRRAHPDIAGQAIRAGIQESLQAGTTLLGEIATTGWSADADPPADFSGVVFQELLGLTEERIASQREVAQRWSASDSRDRTRDGHAQTIQSFVRGLSPHAPYSVHPELLREAISLARHHRLPLAMHLAETEAELELLADGTGEFREMLQEFGLWRDELYGGGKSPLDYLTSLAETPRSLIVHGNYLNETELRYLAAQPHMTLVYCPRTHAAFGHRDHPWRRLLELGGSVAIGTDSRASNPDLSVFAELQFLAERHPESSHLDLLRLGTTNGRVAMTGCPGSPDALANFTVIQLSDPRFRDPTRDLFASGNRVVGTMISGRWVHSSSSTESITPTT